MLFRQMFCSTPSTCLLAGGPDREAAIIDPVKEQLEAYLGLIRDWGLRLARAIDTHTRDRIHVVSHRRPGESA